MRGSAGAWKVGGECFCACEKVAREECRAVREAVREV
jgi:hypothetical protein